MLEVMDKELKKIVCSQFANSVGLRNSNCQVDGLACAYFYDCRAFRNKIKALVIESLGERICSCETEVYAQGGCYCDAAIINQHIAEMKEKWEAS